MSAPSHNRFRSPIFTAVAPVAFVIAFGALLSGLTSSVEASPMLPVLLVPEMSLGFPLSMWALSRKSRRWSIAILVLGGVLSTLLHATVLGLFCEPPQIGVGVIVCWVFLGLWFPMLLAPLLTVVRSRRTSGTSQSALFTVAAFTLAYTGVLGFLAAMDPLGRVLPGAALLMGAACFAFGKWSRSLAAPDPNTRFEPLPMGKSIGLAFGTFAVVALCVVASFDRAPKALRDAHEHYSVQPFKDYAIEGVSLWYVAMSSDCPQGPVVGWDKKRKVVVGSEQLFRRLRGLSPDTLAQRHRDIVRWDVKGPVLSGVQAREHQVPPPSVHDGHLVYYAGSCYSPALERIDTPLEPGMLGTR